MTQIHYKAFVQKTYSNYMCADVSLFSLKGQVEYVEVRVKSSSGGFSSSKQRKEAAPNKPVYQSSGKKE